MSVLSNLNFIKIYLLIEFYLVRAIDIFVCAWLYLGILIFCFMAALCNRVGRYIFALWFLSSASFFPRLISAVGDWMSTILPYMVWP